jgi:hypothetical protein
MERGVQPREFYFDVWRSGWAYDFNNEYRDTNSNIKKKERTILE